MENESEIVINQILTKHENHTQFIAPVPSESEEAGLLRLRALIVALLGFSMSACALSASQPDELDLEDDDVAERLNNVSFARRLTKPTIRVLVGYGRLSAVVTAVTSFMLLVAVMSKQSWWRRGARWLAAPALLVAALEATSDIGDTMLSAAIQGTDDPARVLMQVSVAAVMITIEILVWYFIAKFFEYNPPPEETVNPNELKKIQ